MSKLKRIYIDAGHGGADPGAIGNGLREADLNIIVTNEMADYLVNNYKCEVYKDITGDKLTTIAKRANSWGADLVVSNHVNAGGGDGYEALVYGKANLDLGKIFEKKVLALGQNSRGVKYRPDLIILNSTKAPAVLNEMAFIDNAKDIKDWDEKHEVKKIAIAYAEAAAEYLKLEKKSSVSVNSEEPFKVKIICDQLNIRKGPGTEYADIGDVYKNEVFTIVKTEKNGQWGLLKMGPVVGSSYISLGSSYVKRV